MEAAQVAEHAGNLKRREKQKFQKPSHAKLHGEVEGIDGSEDILGTADPKLFQNCAPQEQTKRRAQQLTSSRLPK